MKNYSFDGSISREVLENYLSRAVTAAGLYNSDTLPDDLRMIRHMGAKFLGRASGVWEMDPNDEEHFRKSEELAARVHAMDPEIILQTCIFEAIYRELEQIRVPAWVFEAFGLPVEDRNFRFDDMLFDNKPKGFIWGTVGAIPNIDKLEARLWFYYRAARYIDCGYEGIHMGQIHLYSADDLGYRQVYELFGKIRAYARQKARRHMILLDAHTHGINVEGRLLFDFHSIPFSRMPILDVPGEKLAFVKEGFSEGGLAPSGWECDTLPVLMEFDNWGGKFFREEDGIPYEKRAWKEWWGYDQIAWFASQDSESRNRYLDYAWRWTAIADVNAYCQMPAMRTLGSCRIDMTANGGRGEACVYKANRASDDCPAGFSQEDTIKRIWESEGDLRKSAGNPAPRVKGLFGAENTYHPRTGLKLPSRVILYGNFQHHVGALNYDSNSETTRMYHLGDGLYTLTCILPFAGEYEYAAAPYGTLSQVYSIDGYPRSGSCDKARLVVERDNSVVRFVFDFDRKTLSAEIIM